MHSTETLNYYLAPGKILIAGGIKDGDKLKTPLSSIEVIDIEDPTASCSISPKILPKAFKCKYICLLCFISQYLLALMSLDLTSLKEKCYLINIFCFLERDLHFMDILNP